MASSNPSRGSSTAAISSKLYTECRSKFPPNKLLYQQDLLDLQVIPSNDLAVLLECTQSLVDQKLFRLLHDKENRLAWKIISQEDAEKFQSLTPDESMIYNVIHSTGRAGIWQRALIDRTNLTKSIVLRCLKSLEGKNYIKTVRDVRNPTKITYMLAELIPSEAVTGGAWFTDGVLDTDFVNVLAGYIELFVSRKSWYEVPITDSHGHRDKRQRVNVGALKPDSEKQYLPYPAGYQGYPTALDITDEVNKSGVTPVTMDQQSIAQLLEMLCYDNKLTPLNDGQAYKSVRRPKELGGMADLGLKPTGETKEAAMTKEAVGLDKNGMTEVPCGQCPVFELCTPGGIVSPENCEYFDPWLERALGF